LFTGLQHYTISKPQPYWMLGRDGHTPSIGKNIQRAINETLAHDGKSETFQIEPKKKQQEQFPHPSLYRDKNSSQLSPRLHPDSQHTVTT